MSEALTFLETVIPALHSGETVELRAIPHAGGDVRSSFHTSPTPLIRQAGALAQGGYHVYVGINPRRRASKWSEMRGDHAVSRIGAIPADIDGKLWAGITVNDPNQEPISVALLANGQNGTPPEEKGICVNYANIANGFGESSLNRAVSAVRSFAIRPSVAVCSGGGVQCYWLLDGPLSATEDSRKRYRVLSERLSKAVCGSERTPDLIGNASQTLRLPGTLNWKYTPGRPVQLLWCDAATRYSPDDLEAWLDEHAAWTQPVERPITPFVPRERQDDVIADFNARYDVGALLIRHGAWEMRPAHGYRRFAKRDQHSISATLDYYPNTVVLQADGFLGMTKHDKRGYDAFAVFTHLEHGGDGKAAYEAAQTLGYGPVQNRNGMRVFYTNGAAACRALSSGVAS